MAGPRRSLIVKLPVPRRTAEPAQSRHPNRPEVATEAHISKPPAPAYTPASIGVHFSQSQLATALTISKSKPEGLSMKEYFQQLRKHFKTGQPTPRNELRYIDTAEFWKDQYTRLHLEKKALEDKVNCLEEARRLSRKRAYEDDEHDAPQASQEGPSRIDHSHSQLPEVWEISLTDDDYLRLSSYSLKIGRQRKTLEASTIDSGNLDRINAVSKQTLQVLAILENALRDCCLPLRLLKDNEENAKISFLFQQVMDQIALAFLSCLTAIDDLCQTIPGRAKKAEIVYRMVNIFKKGLKLLQNASDDQVADEVMCHIHNSRHKRQKTDEGEYFVNKHLTKALCAIAYNSQWKISQPAHSEILEGLLFRLLEQTGRLLSKAIFGEHVATSDLPGSITKNSGPVTPGFCRPEARYIIQVLHATMGTGERRELVAQMLVARRPNLNAQLRRRLDSPDLSGGLLLKAKKLLQSTLVKSAIGGADLESLRLSTPPLALSDISVEGGREQYGSDWLIEMIWGLIGWEIVCSK